MKKTGKAIAKLGARGFLSILGSMAALAGAACAAYGPAPDYGMPTCTQDSECTNMGADWYCDKTIDRCAHSEPDAGTSGTDAGK
ncbi:MAG TPA: hypothetical protein VGK67_17715 [Myxococcales bacterium]|jgi:hypothetical protein